jgi:L-alanine-DL-glutamate epimerase-like enolase superfamily enzyme
MGRLNFYHWHLSSEHAEYIISSPFMSDRKVLYQSSDFRVQVRPFTLRFKHPFRLAHGTRTTTELVLLQVERGEFIGYGEASLPPYLSETQISVDDFLAKLDWKSILEGTSDIPFDPNNRAARACADIALKDLQAKSEGLSLARYLELEEPISIPTTFTISANDEAELRGRIADAEEFQLLKIKLTGLYDADKLRAFRKHTSKDFVVDVNQGWKSREEAIKLIEMLDTMGVIFIEQPIPVNRLEDIYWLSERTPVPLVADEDFTELSQIQDLTEVYQGLNVKLMKLGGIDNALKALKAMGELNTIKVLGAMAESSCALSAAAQLAGMADYVDLDGALLSSNDPFKGVQYRNGAIYVSESTGHGAQISL